MPSRTFRSSRTGRATRLFILNASLAVSWSSLTLKGDIAVVDDVFNFFVRVGKNDLADADVVDKNAFVVDHVDHVDGLAVFPDFADMVDDLPDGPIFMYGDVVGGHKPADAAFGVTEEGECDLAFFGVQGLDEFLDDFAGQFFEEGGPVVRRKVVQEFGARESG